MGHGLPLLHLWVWRSSRRGHCIALWFVLPGFVAGGVTCLRAASQPVKLLFAFLICSLFCANSIALAEEPRRSEVTLEDTLAWITTNINNNVIPHKSFSQKIEIRKIVSSSGCNLYLEHTNENIIKVRYSLKVTMPLDFLEDADHSR